MPKITIPSIEKVLFVSNYKLAISDINYGGHMGNERILALAHNARIDFLESLGYSELNIEGTGVIMHNAGVNYKSEGFRGDEIQIEIGISFESKFKFDLFYNMINLTTGKTLATAFTGMASFDYAQRRVTITPGEFKDKLARL